MTADAPQSAVVWGLGRHGGGVAVTRYLLKRGTKVTVVDAASERDLTKSLDELADVRDRLTMLFESSVDQLDPDDFDTLVANPAIPLSHPDWQQWEYADHVTITSDLGLLAHELLGHRVVAITGTNGKSTVSAWVASLLEMLDPDRPLYLGGNFERGLSPHRSSHLLEIVPLPKPSNVVLECSSFQAAHLRNEPFQPDVAAITNITPNHIDWHDKAEYYEQSKRLLLARADITIEPDNGRSNANTVQEIMAALGFTVSDEQLTTTEPNVSHRREHVVTNGGVTFIDDSAATTPESVTYLLNQYPNSNVLLIAGGRNKGFDVDAFARAIAPRVKAVATIGETASELAKYVAIHGGKVRSHRSLAKAVKWTRKLAQRGDIIALSPGMASTDMFLDYRDRGHAFQQLLPDADD